MSDLSFDYMTEAELEKLSLDELRLLRKKVQIEKKKVRVFVLKIKALIEGIYQENEALRTLTPEMAKALGFTDARLKVVKQLQELRKTAVKEGKSDVVIQHVKTLTVTPAGVKRKEGK